MGDSTQIKGQSCLNKKETCSIETGSYQFLNEQPIYSISDNVLQLTRDYIKRGFFSSANKILIGFTYHSSNSTIDGLPSLTKSILHTNTASNNIGFRLIRYKKNNNGQLASFLIEGYQQLLLQYHNPKKAKPYNLRWDKKPGDLGNSYIWNQTFQIYIHASDLLEFMINNKNAYPAETQRTIEALSKTDVAKGLASNSLSIVDAAISDLTPLRGLTNIKKLYLLRNNIADLSPLASLTKLEILRLRQNNISDITPLKNLINLRDLDLGQNHISDISSLAGLTNLHSFSVDQNHILDINFPGNSNYDIIEKLLTNELNYLVLNPQTRPYHTPEVIP